MNFHINIFGGIMVRHFLTLKDYSGEEIKQILDKAIEIKKNPEEYSDVLKNKTLIMLFQKTSTRTRLSFEAGMTQLGGHAIFLDWRTTQFIIADFVDEIRGLSIDELWFACDNENSIKPLRKALGKCKHFSREKLLCYVLCGDDMDENENRLRQVWEAGAIPFSQLYQPADHYIHYSKEWKQFSRKWSRPAIIKAMCKNH